ncbi:hypothetical protein Pla108_19370 [Botrimarina colliarenosi]|uniref:Uncharacterized protein n=2 Tax=Botrimarina colliarenosi TaxID=2528001 RepID=A0A5C6AF22_9BACT|nr:hypothetical protein Pla108_19370 [Botrimarina colliarenosi]
MPAATSSQDPGPDASDVCCAAQHAGPWPTPPDASESAQAYFARLVDDDRQEEAIRFVAAWLGPRRAVWWGSLCVWRSLRSNDDAVVAHNAAIDAAVAWVIAPNEENRRAAGVAAEAAGYATAAGASATAAFWSEGSISLPGQPEVPPPAGVSAKAAANAVLMAAANPSAPVRHRTLRQSLRMAAEILGGANLWPYAPFRKTSPPQEASQ